MYFICIYFVALLFIITGTFIVALSIIGVIGSRTKSRTLLLFVSLYINHMFASTFNSNLRLLLHTMYISLSTYTVCMYL
jgi:hypothetical protein